MSPRRTALSKSSFLYKAFAHSTICKVKLLQAYLIVFRDKRALNEFVTDDKPEVLLGLELEIVNEQRLLDGCVKLIYQSIQTDLSLPFINFFKYRLV